MALLKKKWDYLASCLIIFRTGHPKWDDPVKIVTSNYPDVTLLKSAKDPKFF
jgi:hypothetical protein